MSSQLLSPSLNSLIQEYNLDISIVGVNELENSSRFDSEYYGLELIKIATTLIDSRSLGEIAKTVDLQSNGAFAFIFDTINDGNNKVVPYIRSGNVGDFFVNTQDLICISKESHDIFSKTHTKKGDIIMARKGKIGGATLITQKEEDFNSNDNVCNIRLQNITEYIPEYVVTFLNCKYGYKQVERFSTGNVQPWLSMAQVRQIKIFKSSPLFQSHIAELVQEAHSQRELSKSLYAEAEHVLLRELGLIDWIPTEVGITEKMSVEVQLFGRCDAEFFQSKYDELFEKLAKFQTQKLGDIVDYQKGVEPGADAYSESGIPFIRVADVSIDGINSIEKNISSELLTEYGERYSPKKDEILFTKDGTIGISFVVNEDMRAVLSGAFLRLQKKIEIESEYLALVLNSVVSKMQIERFSGGAIIAHLKPSDAMEILIPVLSPDIQSLISSRIIASHRARDHSKRLLERAKRAVEIFIEEDGNSAETYLRSNMER